MRKIASLLLILITTLSIVACGNKTEPLKAIQSFEIKDTLPIVEETSVKVVLLYGQSNATGVSYNDYLGKNLPSTYAKAREGYENVKINFFTENGSNSSNGSFVNVTLGQGASKDHFGPEIGLAEELSSRYENETVFIIKYSWGGSILHDQWLDGNQERGELYKAAINFTKASLEYLSSKGYAPILAGVCWMQGESDSITTYSSHYYDNTKSLAGFLREDLKGYYTEELTFIDAGIAEIEAWRDYKIINRDKEKFAEEGESNVFFSTAEMGLTTNLEPSVSPDVAHYDSVSMIELGRKFASFIP